MSNHYGSVFTYQERKKLRYGTQKQRVGRDSCKKFDCCSLCLFPVVDPVVCLEGHVYCKECIYENLLTQKQEISRKEKLYEKHKLEEARREEEQRQAAMQALVDEFHVTQTSLLPASKRAVYTSQDAQREGIASAATSPSAPAAGQFVGFTASNGLAFVLNAAAVEAKRREQQDLATKRLAERQANAGLKPGDEKYLPSFWLPSLTPEAKQAAVQPPAQEVYCPVGNHTLKLKQLVTVVFVSAKATPASASSSPSAAGTAAADRGQKRPHEDDDSSEDSWICPSCVRVLNNNPKLCVLKPCGHVFCRSCVDKFFVQAKSPCTVCNRKVADPAKDIIDIKSDGTGFAGHGENLIAVRHDVAFQS